MKKRILVTTMALAMAFSTVMGSANTLTVYATDDGADHGDGREPGGGGNASWGTSGSSSSSNSGSSSSSSGGSSSSGSTKYDDGADHGDGREAGGGGDISWSTSTSAPKAAGTEASAGKEKFRATANAGAGTYKVTHKGVDIATFKLMDADKKNVACTKVTLKLRDDKKYAINYEIADATGLTVGAPLDRTYMYNTLGVSYVTINDTIVIDIEAEAQAAAAK